MSTGTLQPRAELLLAEDEPALREALVTLFADEGYAVRAAADGEAALKLFAAHRPDLVVLDVMMPKKDGYAVCAAIRRRSPDVPILFLTARDAAADELRGLLTGADDYVAKTVSMPVLLARLAGLLARARRAGAPVPCAFDVLDCRVEPATGHLVRADGARVALIVREIEILRAFAARPGEVFSRDWLIAHFWGTDCTGGEAALTTALSRLRDKLGARTAYLQTVYGQGYRLKSRG